MHNSKLLQSLSFQNRTGFSDFSPTAKECARGFRAARHFLPPQLFFLSFFSNPPKFCPNLSGKLPKSGRSFSRILHRRFSSPSTSNQNPERRQRGQKQQRQRTEIQAHRNRGGSHRHGCANPRWTSSSPSVEAGVSAGGCAIGRRAAAMSPQCGNALALCFLLSPPISRTTDSYPPPAKTNKFRQILLPFLRQKKFGKVLEGFVSLVLIRLILLIFMEKFDNFF